MPSLFSRLKGRDGKLKSKKGGLDNSANQQPQKPRWEDAWTRKTVEPEEVHELIRLCTEELKARGMTSNSASAAPSLRIKWPPSSVLCRNVSANGCLQPSISRFYYSLSGRRPIRARFVPLCDTFLVARMAVKCFAEKPWLRSCG